jgi:dTDP-4-dehydrorhamnose reductase
MSSSEKIALIGGTGQLGSDLRISAETAGIPVAALSHHDLDVSAPETLVPKLRDLAPTVVINCAAFHQVERCEETPLTAFQINALGALNVARAAEVVRARCVFISTDYVFDGEKKAPLDGHLDQETGYVETDFAAPVNVYGASKLAGESLTLQSGERNLVVRISSLFGVAGARGKGGNFIETILKRAREGGALQVVNDQWMTPTYATDAAGAIVDLACNHVNGIIHVTNSGACTWHTFAAAAVQAVGLEARVDAVPSSSLANRAPRPVNSALATGKLADHQGKPLRRWEEALRAYLVAKGYCN